MNQEQPKSANPTGREKELNAPSSRLTDEKISDDSGTEAKSPNSALAPAGMKNPFWK
ncbi:MAG: hypothetical protein ACLQLC_15505 [Candidatus Sulfotelmatobacter sp.]|jgi:hypothetical protein